MVYLKSLAKTPDMQSPQSATTPRKLTLIKWQTKETFWKLLTCTEMVPLLPIVLLSKKSRKIQILTQQMDKLKKKKIRINCLFYFFLHTEISTFMINLATIFFKWKNYPAVEKTYLHDLMFTLNNTHLASLI